MSAALIEVSHLDSAGPQSRTLTLTVIPPLGKIPTAVAVANWPPGCQQTGMKGKRKVFRMSLSLAKLPPPSPFEHYIKLFVAVSRREMS